MAVLTGSPPALMEEQEQRVLIHNVSWDTYERLVTDCAGASTPLMAYDQGELEIMSPSRTHEKLKELAANIVEIAAEEWEIDVESAGSTTWRRREFLKGAEADACFYIQNELKIRNKEEIDLAIDPPPDLVIEVEISSPAVDRLLIYARLGVPEIWIMATSGVRILTLSGSEYHGQAESEVMPPITDPVLFELMNRRQSLSPLAWRKSVRQWARQHSGQR